MEEEIIDESIGSDRPKKQDPIRKSRNDPMVSSKQSNRKQGSLVKVGGPKGTPIDGGPLPT